MVQRFNIFRIRILSTKLNLKLNYLSIDTLFIDVPIYSDQ